MTGVVPIILCGGSGTRLWPRSRATKPKPFLTLVGEHTLFEATLARCDAASGFAPPVVITGRAHLEHVESQLTDAHATIVVEPEAKNTAAAIALAAVRLPPDAIMLVCPSDHHIEDVPAFAAAARAAVSLAAEGWLASFGIDATAPETGFGYLRRGAPLDDRGFRVAAFVEKPDRVRAEAFLATGDYSWNGGIFAFRAGTFMAELTNHRPQIASSVRTAVDRGMAEGRRFHPDAGAFATIIGESVDYAVMESTSSAAMVPASMRWSDIGNWDALHAARPRDARGNAIRGEAELVDCRNVLVDTDGPSVSVIGLENVIIAIDGDDVLVTTAAGAQQVGKLAAAINQ